MVETGKVEDSSFKSFKTQGKKNMTTAQKKKIIKKKIYTQYLKCYISVLSMSIHHSWIIVLVFNIYKFIVTDDISNTFNINN